MSITSASPKNKQVAVIGGGPSGLMAADVLVQHGIQVDIYDSMPSVGRKFLMAGKGGLNITHAEPYPLFLTRFGAHRCNIEPLLNKFTPNDIRAWVHGLNVDTFVGSSGRVFPAEMKAAPLLRAWLHRLRQQGVRFHMRHQWCGLQSDNRLIFKTPEGQVTAYHNAVLLALGGGSWPQLGSDGSWVPILQQLEVNVAPLRPSNCGFDLNWSSHFRERFEGEPLKAIAATFGDMRKQGECLITQHGVEGGLIYAFSAALRDEIERNGSAILQLDLLPDRTSEFVSNEINHPRGSRSLSSHLQSRLGIKGVKTNLLREVLGAQNFKDPILLARAVKCLPLKFIATRPLSEAISCAGGVKFEELDDYLMLRNVPGVFCAGEMLDWEAPTGGYLLSACLASGKTAGEGILKWILAQPHF